MKVQWYGQSCFLIEGQGIRLVTDPPSGELGYALPAVAVDLVCVSHDHYDHNNIQALRGAPLVLKTPGVHEFEGLRMEGISSFHDDTGGSQRGRNLIFVWEMDGVRTAHLGDLGSFHDAALQSLGRVDLLLIPVGGVYTIDAAGAKQVVAQLRPRIVIPMHFKTPVLSIKLAGVEEFLGLFQPGQVQRKRVLEIEAAGLPDNQEIVVLDYRASAI